MKQNFKDGKWMPENGTFVRVPNDRIPEVIQLLRDNGQNVPQQTFVGDEDGMIFDEEGEWYTAFSDCRDRHLHRPIPFPDFKALVTGKLPESWCIQCTEESMKHEEWDRFKVETLGYAYSEIGTYYGFRGGSNLDIEPFGEVLQLPTWAAMNPLSELEEALSDPEIRNHPDNNKRILLPKPFGQKEIHLSVDKAIISDLETQHLITELKSRGYTVSKIY